MNPKGGPMVQETILQLTVNVDDMTGEEIGFAMDILLEHGALDVYTQSISMKKNRPAVMIHVLSKPAQKETFVHLLLLHTTSLGVRIQELQRYALQREEQQISTSLGTVRIKKSWGNLQSQIQKTKIEYEDLQALAKKHGKSLQEIKDILRKELP